MYAWFVVKSAGLWVLGAGLLVAGALALAYPLGLVLWQYVTTVQTGAAVGLPAGLLFVDRALAHGPQVAAVLPYIPHVEWAWFANPGGWLALHEAVNWTLAQVHVGVPFALIAVPLILAGMRLTRRQKVAFTVVRMRRADRLRRRQEYRKAAAAAALTTETSAAPAALRTPAREAAW
jgi:hypothetical protein